MARLSEVKGHSKCRSGIKFPKPQNEGAEFCRKLRGNEHFRFQMACNSQGNVLEGDSLEGLYYQKRHFQV